MRSLDDAVATKRLDAPGVQAELAQHLIGVLAQGRRAAALGRLERAARRDLRM